MSKPSFKIRKTGHCLITHNDLDLHRCCVGSWLRNTAHRAQHTTLPFHLDTPWNSRSGKKGGKRTDPTILESKPKASSRVTISEIINLAISYCQRVVLGD